MWVFATWIFNLVACVVFCMFAAEDDGVSPVTTRLKGVMELWNVQQRL